MANRIDLNVQPLTSQKGILVDTNILIYLFDSNTTNDYGYSNFLSTALINKCEIYINSQIISEFINVICRVAYEEYRKVIGKSRRAFQYKRDYRNTPDFISNYKDALDIITNEILPIFEVLPIEIEQVNSSLVYDPDLLDYNDVINVLIANKRGLAIASHDNDIISYPGNLEVLHY